VDVLRPTRRQPLNWIRRRFPELEGRPTFITVAACVLLIVYSYHGKPGDYAEYFLDGARTSDRDLSGYYSYCYSHLAAVVILMAVPLVLIKWPLRDGWLDYGLRLRGTRREFLIVLGLYVGLLPILYFVSSTDAFQAKYPKLRAIEDDVTLFWLYQAAYLVKWVAWEFFFRGFLLFGFRRKFGEHAILISTIPFVLTHVGKPEAEIFGAIVAGFVLCRLALDGRSIFPGVLLHFLVAGTVDFLTSGWWR
jgi:membrane protease YdiL (CAAX protease family)